MHTLCLIYLRRTTCLGWFLGMWIQGRENVPMIPNKKTLQFWSVRHAKKTHTHSGILTCCGCNLNPCCTTPSFPLQMTTCTQVYILTSWAQMRLCLGPWEGGRPSGRSSMTPGGWTVSQCGREELNTDDCRLGILSFYLTTACFNPPSLFLSLPICFYPPEPVFIQIQQIPDSAEKNDDKLYFFFREKSLETTSGASPTVLSRVGRVCLVSWTLLTAKSEELSAGRSFHSSWTWVPTTWGFWWFTKTFYFMIKKVIQNKFNH